LFVFGVFSFAAPQHLWFFFHRGRNRPSGCPVFFFCCLFGRRSLFFPSDLPRSPRKAALPDLSAWRRFFECPSPPFAAHFFFFGAFPVLSHDSVLAPIARFDFFFPFNDQRRAVFLFSFGWKQPLRTPPFLAELSSLAPRFSLLLVSANMISHKSLWALRPLVFSTPMFSYRVASRTFPPSGPQISLAFFRVWRTSLWGGIPFPLCWTRMEASLLPFYSLFHSPLVPHISFLPEFFNLIFSSEIVPLGTH